MSFKFSRLFKKFYVFLFFIFGISLYSFLKRSVGNLPQVPIADPFQQSYSNQDGNIPDRISKKLNALEGEIASQKVYSSVLVQKLRDKLNKAKASVVQNGIDDEGYKKVNQYILTSRENVAEAPGSAKNVAQSFIPQEVNISQLDTLIDGRQNHDNRNSGDVYNQGGDASFRNSEDKADDSVIAVLVMVCNRPTVKRCLDSLFRFRPNPDKFPIIVSQDCGKQPVTSAVLDTYGDSLIRIWQPDLTEIKVPLNEKKLKGYYNIARHYGWALNYTFNSLHYKNVIIVEDDLDLAPDFFEYFGATLPLLRSDSSLWCVSAWNDNGKPKRINETGYDVLHRTDFFPGLGWMLTKELWDELMVNWPRGYWDDWMREPAQRKNRACIRPEISRTSTFGKYGVSHGTYYQNHLRHIKLNDHFVPFTKLDLSYLHKDKYDLDFVRKVYSSQLVSTIEELDKATKESKINDAYRITYRSKMDFIKYAKKLELMEDFRAGVPRTAYRGVVPFIINNHKAYLAPGANWVAYSP